MATEPKFETRKDARAAGWYSRRHETDAAHVASRERYQTKRGRSARIRRAQERLAAAESVA